MGIDRGSLDRRITIMRSAPVDDGTATVAGPLAAIGKRWAKRSDVSDAERVRASENGSELATRWLVGSDPLTRSITGKDVLSHAGQLHQVTGTKEVGRLDGIEVTTSARPDAT